MFKNIGVVIGVIALILGAMIWADAAGAINF